MFHSNLTSVELSDFFQSCLNAGTLPYFMSNLAINVLLSTFCYRAFLLLFSVEKQVPKNQKVIHLALIASFTILLSVVGYFPPILVKAVGILTAFVFTCIARSLRKTEKPSIVSSMFLFGIAISTKVHAVHTENLFTHLIALGSCLLALLILDKQKQFDTYFAKLFRYNLL